jgi:DNA processing protein
VVTDAADLLDLVGRLGEDASVPRRGDDSMLDGLDPDCRAVHDALPVRRRSDPPTLVRTTGLPMPRVLRALGVLLAHGLADDRAGRWRKAS